MALWIVKNIVLGALIHMMNGQWSEGPRPCIQHNLRFGYCVPFNFCPFVRSEYWKNEISYCGLYTRFPMVCCPRYKPSVRSGSKSREKCEEYHNTNEIYSYEENSRTGNGEESLARQFPHMVALGFGDENDIQWRCGGSLISERFVLTAGHCLFSQELGEVKFVRLGDLDLVDVNNTNGQQYNISERIKHPDYIPPSQYHDIALMKLDRDVEFTNYVKPICLQVSNDLRHTIPIATGWGSIEDGGEISSDLKKVELQYFSNEQCRQTYGPGRQLQFGVIEEFQICAGGINDTCQGDSGGPLQVQISTHPTVYNIIGITSFGKGCGVADIPAVYTRISNYIGWVEAIVWPD